MLHIPDRDLERYCSGLVTDEEETDLIEEHLEHCPECVTRLKILGPVEPEAKRRES